MRACVVLAVLMFLFPSGMMLFPKEARSCTLWSAAGKDASGGTIAAKNRDWKPDHTQKLSMERKNNGLAYFGLYAAGGENPGLKAGVNEKGLCVLSAAASCIPTRIIKNQPGKKGITALILSRYSNVNDLLRDREKIFPSARAVFLLVSDRKRVAIIEIGLNGVYSISTVTEGAMAHTNHYLDNTMAAFNIKFGKSSTTRLQRIKQLLSVTPRPFSVEKFVTMSLDKHDGPENSLWRTSPKKPTLSSWILSNPPAGPARLRVVIADPGRKEILHEFILDERFWKTAK